MLAVLVAHLRSPTVPARVTAIQNKQGSVFYDRGYVDRLKVRQIKAAWLGSAVGAVLFTLLSWLLIHLTTLYVARQTLEILGPPLELP